MLRILLLALLATSAGMASAVTVSDAYPRYMDEDLFKTATEYLRGEQREGAREIVRTQPEARSGQYFILTLDPSVNALPQGAEIVLEVLRSDAREHDTYRFSMGAPRRSTDQLYIGVTGTDWPDRQVQPMAWRVQLVAGAELIAEWKSFLWEMP